jgi:hypothetical protein
MLAQLRNQSLDACTTSFIPKFPIASIPNELVVSSAAKLGVSVGVSPSKVSSSINLLRKLIYIEL